MIKFYIIVLIELLFSPILLLFELLKRFFGRFLNRKKISVREVIPVENEVLFVIHEWAGYPFCRAKRIKYVNKDFTCGLKFHFERLASYNGKFKLDKILTVSDCSNTYLESLKNFDSYTNDFKIIPVENSAMDFSGYSFVVNNLINRNREQIVFLTNTSVSSDHISFIDSYIRLFQEDPSLGLLGISYSTKVYQTFIKNNFRPHLQSFFLVTKTSVLKAVLKANNGNFPGAEETYKLAIIRFGEVRLTELVQSLGYKAAVVTESGELYHFPSSTFFTNGYSKWKLPRGDYRLHCNHPNKINELNENLHNVEN